MQATSPRANSRRQSKSSELAIETVAAWWWVPVAIGLLTAVAFLPVLQNDFIDWDDHANYLANPDYRGLSWGHLRWMFTTFYMSLYRPVTWITLGSDYLVWGMDPAGYHLTSLLFHCANAILFYYVVLRLLRLGLSSKPAPIAGLHLAAGFAALIFSLHPLRVEPVAWASGRENVVSALFLLLTILCYLKAVAAPQDRNRRWYWIGVTLVTYGLSLLSKAAGMTFPLALLALDIYPLKRLDGNPKKWLRPEARSIFWEKGPFLLMSVATGITAVLAKHQSQAIQTLDKYNFPVRIAESFYGLVFYLWKTLLPFNLSPLYELAVNPDPLALQFVISGCISVAITGLVLIKRHDWPAGLVSWVYYVLLLLPVLGIVQFGRQIAADRYSYLACLPWALLAGAGALYSQQLQKAGRIGNRAFGICKAMAIMVLILLGLLTWNQSQIWRNSETLWHHALAVDPQSSFAHHMLAIALHNRGKANEAIEHYRESVRLDPNFVQAHYNLAGFLAKQGGFSEATYHFRRAIEIDPGGPAVAYYNLGNVLAKQGFFDESIKYYRIGLQRNPSDAIAYNELANVFAMKGDFSRAAENYQQAAKLDPKASQPYFNLGNLMARQNQLEPAIAYFREALKRDPDHARAHYNCGRIFAAQGKLDEAVSHFRHALRIDPSFAAAHESLVAALIQQGKKAEALREYNTAARLREPRAGRVGQ
jgi:tetratricopeptide (TPR) repeat protein